MMNEFMGAYNILLDEDVMQTLTEMKFVYNYLFLNRTYILFLFENRNQPASQPQVA